VFVLGADQIIEEEMLGYVTGAEFRAKYLPEILANMNRAATDANQMGGQQSP
jgi:hypothetical protein